MADTNQPRPTKHTFKKSARLLDDFFQVDEYHGSYERYDNTMSKEQRLLVFERGDAAAVLLYDPAHREVSLVEQFRLPTVGKGLGNGWILEPAAGMIRAADETPHATALRELIEETGYQAAELVPIATFFVSPGGTSERIFLFYAEVRRVDRKHAGGGKYAEGENIRIVHLPVAEFFARLRNHELEDAKLIVAAYWLKERLALLPVAHAEVAVPVEFYVKPAIKRDQAAHLDKIIGYMAGDILNVSTVDVWVNPLNTDMLLDRFSDRTVSAAIRRHGAEKYPNSDRIKVDTIGEALREQMGRRNFVKPAKVVATTAGALKQSNNLKRIFHVATSKGEIGEDVNADLETIDECVDNVLEEIERDGRYRSVLFPMLGTGDEGLPVNRVAPRMFARAIEFFRRRPKAALNAIYFLAYAAGDRDVVEQLVLSLQDALEPVRKT
jgi:nudix-type nucleoside diphosphatase (YffH/AdpP family)